MLGCWGNYSFIYFLEGKHWRSTNNRKQFFQNFAKDNGFDPNVPENWYRLKKEKLVSAKVSFLI